MGMEQASPDQCVPLVVSLVELSMRSLEGCCMLLVSERSNMEYKGHTSPECWGALCDAAQQGLQLPVYGTAAEV